MKSAQIIDQYPCSLLLIKCLKNFFMTDYTIAMVFAIAMVSFSSEILNFRQINSTQLYSHLKHNLLTDCQYGFGRGFSTEFAITDIQNFLAQNTDKGLVTCSIFLDLVRAFDTVNYDILLHKLNMYSIQSKRFNSIMTKNCLENCSHYVVVNDS